MLERTFSSSELSSKDYHAERDHESSTNLKALLVTPAHYLRQITVPREPTPALSIGSAVHAALLESNVFEQQFALSPKFDRRTRDGKMHYEEFAQQNQGKTILMAEDLEFIQVLRRKLRGHEDAYRLLTLDGYSEMSIFWQDDETGVGLKCRPDRHFLINQRPIHVSVKTTKDAAASAFQWDIARYGYHISEAMYADGLAQVYGCYPETVWVVIEKDTWEVCTYRPCHETLTTGYEEYRTAVRLLKQCRDENRYFGYQPDGRTTEISLPPSVLKRKAAALGINLAGC